MRKHWNLIQVLFQWPRISSGGVPQIHSLLPYKPIIDQFLNTFSLQLTLLPDTRLMRWCRLIGFLEDQRWQLGGFVPFPLPDRISSCSSSPPRLARSSSSLSRASSLAFAQGCGSGERWQRGCSLRWQRRQMEALYLFADSYIKQK